MEFFDLVNISERFMRLINPSTPEKVVTIGAMAGLAPGHRVIEFGCGFGEVLALWGRQFGVGGIGVDIRPYACGRAEQRLAELGLADRFTIVCGRGADYAFEANSFDVAACIGATFIWRGYQPTLRAMRTALRPGGKLIVGEPTWLTRQVPPEGVRQRTDLHTELELWQLTRAEGFELEGVVRSSHEDWDRYESDNWVGLLRWLEANPEHPEHAAVAAHLHERQARYFGFEREHLGWAMYVLTPRRAEPARR